MNASPEGRRPVRRTSVADRSTPQIDVGSLRFRGRGLVRPECVLATADGSLYTADWRGGVAQTRPDGTPGAVRRRAPRDATAATQRHRAASRRLLPARRPGRRRRRRVRAVARRRSGARSCRASTASTCRRPTSSLEDASGRRLDHGEHPARAARRRATAPTSPTASSSSSTRAAPASLPTAWATPTRRWSRRTAAGSTSTRPSAGALSRFRLGPDGDARRRARPSPPSAHGTFPDGLAFDAEGGVWITSIVSNRVIRVAPDGTQALVLEDADPAHLAWVEAAYLAGTMGRPHLDKAAGRAPRATSRASPSAAPTSAHRVPGLPARRRDRELSLRRSPGTPPVHWNWSVR